MTIKEFIKSGKPLVFDGAMGTYYARSPGRAADRCEQANLDNPEEILAIHREYLDAGCNAIKTNTFSVSADFAGGDAELGERIIEAGCRIALDAARPYSAFVFADIGPAPQGETLTPAQNYIRQADIFLQQGLTHFVVETLPSAEGIGELARHLKSRLPESFLLVSFAVGSDGMTRDGLQGSELLSRTSAIDAVDAVGFNCHSGPNHLLQYIKNLDLGEAVLSVMPNAGYPTVLGRRTVYKGSPQYFAEKMVEIVQSGVSIVGGCCGTTPEHIASLKAALSSYVPKPSIFSAARPVSETADVIKPEENTLWNKLEAKKRVIVVELDPPTDDNIGFFTDGVQKLNESLVDAVTIADCPVGRPRADSSLLACKIKRELGVEPLPHLTCRDRNLNATKALLLGLSIEGVHNVLVVTGDPIPSEDRDEVKSVFNFNARKLARYISGLNKSTFTTHFRIFGALNLNARNFSKQLEIALEKEECGISGFLTQPVLSPEALENLIMARSVLKGKILGGIFPVVSHRNALFLSNEISGISVCDEIITLYEGKERAEAEALAVEISVRVAKEIEPYTDGIYLMTPFKRVSLITNIVKSIR